MMESVNHPPAFISCTWALGKWNSMHPLWSSVAHWKQSLYRVCVLFCFFCASKVWNVKKAIWCYCQKSTDCSCLSILTKTGFRFSFAVSAVFDYAYRDYILSWYIPLSHDEGQLYSMLSEDWWQMIGQLRSRLAEIDLVNVVCYDSIRILHTHFTDLKAASARCTNTHSLIVWSSPTIFITCKSRMGKLVK